MIPLDNNQINSYSFQFHLNHLKDKIKIHLSYYLISLEALIRPLIVILKSCLTLVLIESLNNFEKPPVIIILYGLFVSFLIKFIILSINPA